VKLSSIPVRAGFILIAILSSACNQPFDPKGPFEEQLVLYSILSTHRDAQYVRVYQNYHPSGFDPLAQVEDNGVRGAQVQIFAGQVPYPLKDTLLMRTDSSRYDAPIIAYVTRALRPEGGKTYTLRVSSPSLNPADATITLPQRGSLSIARPSLLDFPGNYPKGTELILDGSFSRLTRGFVIRMIIEYTLLDDQRSETRRIEVPISFPDAQFTYERGKYPTVIRATSLFARATFSVGGYLSTLAAVLNQYRTERIVFQRVVFSLLQTEENLFNYYNIVNGFQDSFSIRFDQPLYSNIRGGIGLFGGYTLDSLVYPLPEDFAHNRR